MKIVVIMRGVPGSGKSTVAEQIKRHAIEQMGCSAVIVSNDLFPGYYANPKGSYEWTREKAKQAKKYCEHNFHACIMEGIDIIIVDNCHLTHKSYSHFEKAALAAGYEVVFNVNIPVMNLEYVQKCASRNKHNVTERMIYDMIKAWET